MQSVKSVTITRKSSRKDFALFAAKLENENPGKTIVLDAKTRKILLISKNPGEIAKKLKALGDGIVTLFIGGPHSSEVEFHHFC